MINVNEMTIVELLAFEEGYSSVIYLCSEGYPTIGIGTRIGNKGVNIDDFSLEINLEVAKIWLKRDIKPVSFVNTLWAGTPRYIIIQSMIYQMGFMGFGKFRNTIKHLNNEEWELAADEMLDSKWARGQTANRALRHSQVIRSGSFEGIYQC